MSMPQASRPPKGCSAAEEGCLRGGPDSEDPGHMDWGCTTAPGDWGLSFSLPHWQWTPTMQVGGRGRGDQFSQGPLPAAGSAS